MAENYDVFLRPLREDDAAVSCHWRNNPRIWRYTGSRPDRHITEAMEREWAARAISNPARLNFAICLKSDGTYIGNIYLVDIHGEQGELGIFIGELSAHGHGYGRQALELLKAEAAQRGIRRIIIDVDKDNLPALISYLKSGAMVERLDGQRLFLALAL